MGQNTTAKTTNFRRIDFPEIFIICRGHGVLHILKIFGDLWPPNFEKWGVKPKHDTPYISTMGVVRGRNFYHLIRVRGVQKPQGLEIFAKGPGKRDQANFHTPGPFVFSSPMGSRGRVVPRQNQLAELNKTQFTERGQPSPNPRYRGFNFALIGFAQSYCHNGKSRFLKRLPGVLHKIFAIHRHYQLVHRIKIWGQSDDQILRNRGSISKFAPLYLRNGGQLGVKIFIPNRGPRGLIIEILGSGNFFKGDPLQGIKYFTHP